MFKNLIIINSIKIKNLKLKFQKGFTLVEILLYMGLLAILLVVLTEILVSILAVKTESEATSSVEQDSRFILSRMAYDISCATEINTPPQIGQTRSNLRMTVGGVLYEYAENGRKKMKRKIATLLYCYIARLTDQKPGQALVTLLVFTSAATIITAAAT